MPLQTTTQEHSTIASTSVLSLGSGEELITQSQAAEHSIQIAVALLGSYLPESLSKAQDKGQAVTFFLPRDAVFPEYTGAHNFYTGARASCSIQRSPKAQAMYAELGQSLKHT